ncbi:MAG: hypothetical protein KDA84_08735, partial [Planctomycetaceae bacterium]|nr:hypothetical protein [Planctomycetaceae bacterium]
PLNAWGIPHTGKIAVFLKMRKSSLEFQSWKTNTGDRSQKPVKIKSGKSLSPFVEFRLFPLSKFSSIR